MVNKNMDVFINIDNLFDDNYEQFVGFPEPGITPKDWCRIITFIKYSLF